MSGPPDILVVEDDSAMADVMVRVLRIAGYAPRRVENGKEALAAVADRQPALVLLDLLMPVMDGWQCARELRGRYGAALPIVIVTAAEHARARAAELGADDVLTKPFEMQDFLAIVERYASDCRASMVGRRG